MSDLMISFPVKRNYEGIPIPNFNDLLKISEEKGRVITMNVMPLSFGVYHYIVKVKIKETDGYICFGYKDMLSKDKVVSYIKFSGSSAEVYDKGYEKKNIPGIKVTEGVELIYDMNRKTMSIRYGNGVKEQILDDLPLCTCLYVEKYKDSEYESSESWYDEPFMIQRYILTKSEMNINVFTIKEVEEDDLYNYHQKPCDKIEYVVCNKLFKYKYKGQYNYIINKEMSDGIYHFYYEILSIGSEGISFGYYENASSSNEIYPYIKLLNGLSLKIENNRSTPISNITGKVGDIYEVIYDMINNRMYIRQGNGTTELISGNLPTPIYPFISIGDEKGLVKWIEYYKERKNQEIYDNIELQNYNVNFNGDKIIINGMNVRIGNDVVNEVKVPNTIYGIYNYKKYYIIEYLSNLIKTNSSYVIDNIKDFIKSTFKLKKIEKEYVDKSGSIYELIVLLKYFHDDSNLLDSPDSFVEVVNSLRVDQSDESKKCLVFLTSTPIYQFPKRKIYIRKCYYEMFRHICKCLSVDKSNIVVTGQPGIGKTSFIYVLLYFIRNNFLYYPLNENVKRYLQKEELKKEIESIKSQLQIKEEKTLEQIMDDNNKLIDHYKRNIKMNYEMFKYIIENKSCNPNLKGSYNSTNGEYTITYFNESILLTSIDNGRCLNYITKTNEKNNGNCENYNISELIDMVKFNEFETDCMNNYLSVDVVVEAYLLALRIMKEIGYVEMYETWNSKKLKLYEMRIKDNDELINNIRLIAIQLKEKIDGKKDVFYGQFINDSKDIEIMRSELYSSKGKIANVDNKECIDKQKEINSLFNLLEGKMNELKVIEFTKEDNPNYDDLVEKGLNYHIDDKVINSDNSVWIKNDGKLKDIYIIKGKKYGDEDKRKVYLMRDGVIFKIDSMHIKLNEIRHSIIIVDTINEVFNDSNIIISISSPDHSNNSNYKDSRKELYFDSLSFDEIQDWFVNCIGFNIHSVSDDDDSNDFKRICKKYGNIPRQIYYHYLYRINYENRDYWDYYKQLIESVVGTTGYSKFIEKYMNRSNLPKNDLSNVILKYDLQLKWDNDLKECILQPKEKLKFISEDVEKYIVCKFYPPRNVDEYTQIDNYYKSIKDNDDVLVKRMALKQKIAYKLSKKEIQLYDNTKNSYNFRAKTVTATAKVDTLNDPNFEIDSKKEVYVYNPIDGSYFVYYILNEENYFDLIMNGVFIKILLDGEEDKDNNEKIAESIREYSEKKEGYFIYFVIQNEAVKRCNSHFKVGALPIPARGASTPPLLFPSPQSSLSSNQQQSSLPKVKDFDIYVGTRMYLMRKCFKDMWNIISKDNFAFDYQRNYLILGHSRIGKSVLAEVIRDKILENSINVYYKGEYCNIDLPKLPYVVISDGEVIGEDDYADAKMIIVIDNAYDDKCKTFQSKRFPLVMYIPPFTEDEISKVSILNSLKHTLQPNMFTNYNSIKDEVTFNEKEYAEKIKKYTENYTYNGGIIGNDLITDIDDEIQKVKREDLIEITKGRSKSSLSKTEYQNVFIYETDENDVTKSGKLRFISEKVRDKVYDNLFNIDTMGKCIEMLNVLLDNSEESFAGHIYERIILFLMKNSKPFQQDIATKMIALNNLVKLSEDKDHPTVFVPKIIQSHEGLKTEIENLREENSKITFYDLSYDKSFPDIDALIGPCGIQITINNKHKFAPQMVMILQNLYKIYTKGYNDVKNSFQEINLALRYGYFLISPIENPTIKVVEKRKINKYPDIFRKLTIEDKELDKDKKVRRDLEEKAKEVAKSIRITFTDLKTYVK